MLPSNRFVSRSAGLFREVIRSIKPTVSQRSLSHLHMTPTPQEFLSDNANDYKKLYIGFIRKVIKADTITVGEGENAKPANLYMISKLDEKPVIELLQQVLQKQFNFPVLMNILSQISGRVSLPADLSSDIMKKFLKYGDEEQLFNFRKLLCVSDKKPKYNFSIADINAAISKCFESGRYIEAMKWYVTAQDKLHLAPNRDTFLYLIKGLTPQMKWDEILYILSDMKFHGVPLPRTSADAILAGSADHPASRWRLVGMVLDDVLQQSLSPENHKSGSTQFVMTPAVMKDALMTVLQAKQPLAVLELYSRVTAAYEQPEAQGLSNRLPVHSDHIIEPVGMAAIALKNHSALCQVLRDNVVNSAKASSDGSAVASLFNDLEISGRDLSPEAAINEYAALLATDCVSLLQSRNPTTCGRHFAVAILWSLNNGKTALAAQLWNHFITELIASLQNDKNQQSEAVVAALTQVLAACSRSLDVATVDLETYRHNKRVARFLSSALFNMNSSVSAAGAAAVVDLSARITPDMAELTSDAHFPEEGSGTVGGVSSRVFESILSVDMKLTEDLARDLLSVFTCLQDNKFCFEVLSRCLKHGTVVDEPAMNELFNLLLSDGDHKLVLDLCEYQIKQLEDQYAAQKAALLIGQKDKMRRLEAEGGRKKKASTYDKYLTKQQQSDHGAGAVTAASTLGSRPRAFSPYVYMVAMRSLLAVGEVESALRLLNDEIPAKGYFATNGCYEVAVRALSALGRHADAVAQFRRGVAEKEEYMRLHKELPAQQQSSAHLRETVASSPESMLPMRKMKFSNYVRAADSLHNNEDLLLLALQCCAKARLGMDAMALFDERDALTAKGVAPVLWHKRAELVDNVVLSMASDKYIRMLPGFLRDTTVKQRGGFVPPVRTIQLAVAAAVAAKDSETVGAVLEYAQQFAFRVESDLTRQGLMELLQREVLSEAQQQGEQLQQVATFLESCEPLKNMQ